MLNRHISKQLAPFVDGKLAPEKAQQIQLHLSNCASCRDECEQVRFGMTIVDQLPIAEAPDAIWASIEQALRENRTTFNWRLAFAATVLLLLAGAFYWRIAHPSGIRWEVSSLAGSPAVGAKQIHGTGEIAAGEWIETDATSRASVKIGVIGSVEITPNTRVRVVTARPGEHRLVLARGEIRAKISAPPRLFFVETASSTAVDLGCEYTLSSSEEGVSLLEVTRGWVSFEWKGLESLVPAGASCRTRPQIGPGIPYFDDASENLKHALERFGNEKSGDATLVTILADSRVRDTLSLWHLLSRVEGVDRARVYDRIAALTPVPPGVSREQALKLDPETLKRWREELAWTW